MNRPPLILGAAGQLGTELMRLLEADGATHGDIPIEDAGAVAAAFEARRPELVFNCAAYNAVDRAEDEPDKALAVNRDGARNVAAACARHHARLVHFSTNFVFDGTLDRPYVESDRAHPIGAYGFSKLAGERAVLEADPSALVVRTAAVYGHVGVGFPERIVERARARGELEVVADQSVNPTSAADLAQAAIRLAASDLAGVVHVAGRGCASWFEFAAAVLDESGLSVPVRPVRTDQLQLRAKRPLNGCMESTRVEPLRPWREALHDWAERRKNP